MADATEPAPPAPPAGSLSLLDTIAATLLRAVCRGALVTVLAFAYHAGFHRLTGERVYGEAGALMDSLFFAVLLVPLTLVEVALGPRRRSVARDLVLVAAGVLAALAGAHWVYLESAFVAEVGPQGFVRAASTFSTALWAWAHHPFAGYLGDAMNAAPFAFLPWILARLRRRSARIFVNTALASVLAWPYLADEYETMRRGSHVWFAVCCCWSVGMAVLLPFACLGGDWVAARARAWLASESRD